jgi:hypothetical protein
MCRKALRRPEPCSRSRRRVRCHNAHVPSRTPGLSGTCIRTRLQDPAAHKASTLWRRNGEPVAWHAGCWERRRTSDRLSSHRVRDDMVRVGLALYLMLATAAGPWLCCCTADSLFVLCAGTRPESAGAHCSCGHHGGDRAHPTTKPRGTADDPSQVPRGPCPCKQSRPEPSVFLPPEHSSGAQPGRFLETLPSTEAGSFFLSASSLTLPAGGHSTESIIGSWHDPRDILRALHILRC